MTSLCYDIPQCKVEPESPNSQITSRLPRSLPLALHSYRELRGRGGLYTGSADMKSKVCNKCGKRKQLNEFHLQGRGLLGRKAACAECKNSAQSEHWRANKELMRGKHLIYRKNNLQGCKKASEKHRRANLDKAAAHATLERAITTRKIKKPNRCSSCGGKRVSTEIHGHHEDYSKPLDVMWLCTACHASLHQEKRKTRRRAN